MMDIVATARHYYELLGHKDIGLTEVRIMAKDKNVQQEIFISSEDEMLNLLKELPQDKDIYVGINPRQERKPAEKSDIKKLTMFVLDIDEPKVPPIEIQKFLPDNTVMVSSG